MQSSQSEVHCNLPGPPNPPHLPSTLEGTHLSQRPHTQEEGEPGSPIESERGTPAPQLCPTDQPREVPATPAEAMQSEEDSRPQPAPSSLSVSSSFLHISILGEETGSQDHLLQDMTLQQ